MSSQEDPTCIHLHIPNSGSRDALCETFKDCAQLCRQPVCTVSELLQGLPLSHRPLPHGQSLLMRPTQHGSFPLYLSNQKISEVIAKQSELQYSTSAAVSGASLRLRDMLRVGSSSSRKVLPRHDMLVYRSSLPGGGSPPSTRAEPLHTSVGMVPEPSRTTPNLPRWAYTTSKKSFSRVGTSMWPGCNFGSDILH